MKSPLFHLLSRSIPILANLETSDDLKTWSLATELQTDADGTFEYTDPRAVTLASIAS